MFLLSEVPLYTRLAGWPGRGGFLEIETPLYRGTSLIRNCTSSRTAIRPYAYA